MVGLSGTRMFHRRFSRPRCRTTYIYIYVSHVALVLGIVAQALIQWLMVLHWGFSKPSTVSNRPQCFGTKRFHRSWNLKVSHAPAVNRHCTIDMTSSPKRSRWHCPWSWWYLLHGQQWWITGPATAGLLLNIFASCGLFCTIFRRHYRNEFPRLRFRYHVKSARPMQPLKLKLMIIWRRNPQMNILNI